MKRRLAAILFYDVVDYSSRMAADETSTYEALKTCRAMVIHPLIEEMNGRIVKLMGDGALIEFNSVVDAAACAVAVQERLAERRALHTNQTPIEFRIGLHLGDVIVDGDDVYGEGVNIAARLETLAEPGCVCLSEDAFRQLRGRVSHEFKDLGEQRIKGQDQPLRVFQSVPGTAGGAEQSTPRRGSKRPTIGVLPFANLSQDNEERYFVEGITDDIITSLSKFTNIDVISRNSSFALKDRALGTREIAQKLGARFLVSGSARRLGQEVRVSAQLIDAVDDRQVWAERYDRSLEDIFAVQDEVVGSIVHAIGTGDGVIERSYRRQVKEKPETSLNAYDCFLRARDYFYSAYDTGYDQAERLYERAIELDPNFARAYSALAWLVFLRFKHLRAESFEAVEARAFDLASKSISLDPNDYRGHWALGGIYSYQKKHAQSLAAIGRATQINPNDADLLAWSSGVYVHAGRLETALSSCQRAIRLNPNCPDWYWWEIGNVYFHQARLDEALSALQKMSDPGQAHRLLAATLAHLGRLDEAAMHASAFLKLVPGFSVNEFSEAEPYQDPAELDRYVSGLRLAGLPD
jgi:TolB-like protein/Tfp pilus assembly protein PilF